MPKSGYPFRRLPRLTDVGQALTCIAVSVRADGDKGPILSESKKATARR
jgi:hypothetical protein